MKQRAGINRDPLRLSPPPRGRGLKRSPVVSPWAHRVAPPAGARIETGNPEGSRRLRDGARYHNLTKFGVLSWGYVLALPRLDARHGWEKSESESRQIRRRATH